MRQATPLIVSLVLFCTGVAFNADRKVISPPTTSRSPRLFIPGQSTALPSSTQGRDLEPVSAETQPVSGQPRTQISDIEHSAS